MVRCGLVCVLLAGLAWGQEAKPSSPAPAQERQSQAPDDYATVPPVRHVEDHIDSVPVNAPVITIEGLCDFATAGKAKDPKCKTIVTRAEFDQIVLLTQPGAPPQLRRVLAKTYIDTLDKAQMALETGLDKREDYEGRFEVLRLLFYGKALNDKFEDVEWAKVTDKQIDDYYRDNPKEFLIVDVERIFLPRYPPDEKPGENLSESEKQKRQEAWDRTLKEKAESLRARAVAGEDFLKLQNEAYTFTGVTNIQGPEDVTLRRIRRKMFDSDQKSVMDLNPGETSPPLYDETRGYCIFRVDTKSTLPLEKVRAEIHKMFQTEAIKKDLHAVEQATIAATALNQDYFGPEMPEENDSPATTAAPVKVSPPAVSN